MKIDEKVFKRVIRNYNRWRKRNFPDVWRHLSPSELNYGQSCAYYILQRYLAEIEKPICIKPIKKNVMIIRGEK